jgi:phosphoglycerate kinase
MDKLAINQLPVESLRGRRVFVRVDADTEAAPAGRAFGEPNLRAALPTLEFLRTMGARVVIGTHSGDPRGQRVEALRVDGIAERLSQWLDWPVRKLDEAIGRNVVAAVTELRQGEMILLENLRFYPGEDANDDQFARALAVLCDVYCNDAFALADRILASTVAITRHVQPRAAGLALARELTMFEPVLERPEPPFVGLIAGARIDEKLPLLQNLLPKLDRLFIGGALAAVFLKAEGRETGAVEVDEALLPFAEHLLHHAEKKIQIFLPEDSVVVHPGAFKAYRESGGRAAMPNPMQVLASEVTPRDLPVDVGPRTVKRIRQLIDGARTFFWNGPLGVWEVAPFDAGTREVARALLEPRPLRAVVCGDSLARAVRSFGLPLEQFVHLSSGGAAALQWLAGKPLSAVEALSREIDLIAPVEHHPHKILLPVDGSKPALEGARKLGALVDAANADITVLYVQTAAEAGAEIPLMDAEHKRRRELQRRLDGERVIAGALAELARQGLLAQRQIVVEGDDAAAAILKWADELAVELIVMGSRGRTGLIGYFIGSVSRKVLERSRCPTLIARSGDPRALDEIE